MSSNADPLTGALTLDGAASVAPPAAEPLPSELGGFRILGKLGEGGMGIVYEAEQQNPHRRVALKVVRGGQFVDDQYLRMFRRETETLARLTHRNIAALYESGRTEDGRHYFTMELVAGETLDAWARDHLGGDAPGPAQVRERLRLFVTICQAVNYAHQRGVIHRDLKPANIVVTADGPKILDFGLARITAADVGATLLSRAGEIHGTLAYMSPEQASGDSRDIDLRTDVYSLGVVLYELVSGKPPYNTSGISVVQAIRQICEAPPRPLEGDEDLKTIVGKALEKEPGTRYQSASALAEDVERYLGSQPILAHPPSTMYQLKKLVARHRGAVAAAGAIAALLLALAVTMVVQAQRVRRERDRATAEAAKAGAISSFLQDALGAADPWSKGSRNVSLLEALAQAQEKARTAFQSQPLVEASVLQTIGTTFGNLAEFPEAEKALKRSLELRLKAAGRGSEDAGQSYAALSQMWALSKRWEEADRDGREALSIARAVHGEKSLEAAGRMYDLGQALNGAGKYADARSIAGQMLAIARDPANAARAEKLKVETDALLLLVSAAVAEEEYPKLLGYTRERLALLKKRWGDRHPEVAGGLNDLALGQMYTGDLAAAEKTYQQVIELDVALLGPDHPEVASVRENLGNVYFRGGQLEKTARNLELVLAIRRKALGDDSEPVARTLANVGTVWRRAGNHEAAVKTYAEAVERLTKKLGPEHPDVGAILAGMGDSYTKLGRFAEAETALLRALDIQLKAFGESNAVTQRTLKAIAAMYTAAKKPEKAALYSARVASK